MDRGLVLMAEKQQKSEFLTYKGIPLVRSGDVIYYGNMSDKFVIMLQIASHKKKGALDMSGTVKVQLMYTDPDIRAKDRVVKTSEREGLYNAMDIGAVWLQRALADK